MIFDLLLYISMINECNSIWEQIILIYGSNSSLAVRMVMYTLLISLKTLFVLNNEMFLFKTLLWLYILNPWLEVHYEMMVHFAILIKKRKASNKEIISPFETLIIIIFLLFVFLCIGARNQTVQEFFVFITLLV